MEHTFQRSGGCGEQRRRNVQKGGDEEGTSQVSAIWVDIISYWEEQAQRHARVVNHFVYIIIDNYLDV
jgi:hypothetical protein